MSFVGIDFGARKTAISALSAQAGFPTIVSNDQSNQTTPSFVSFRGRTRLAGERTFDEIAQNSRNTVTLLKRHLGGNASAVFQEEALSTPIQLTDAEGSLAYTVDYCGQPTDFRTEQALALLLKRVYGYSRRIVNSDDVKRVGLAIPVIFSEAERHAVKVAAAVAGLPAPTLVSNGFAGVACYASTHTLTDTPSRIAVVDIGHSFCTVTIASASKTEVKILAECCGAFGSGMVDRELLHHFAAEIKRKGIDVGSSGRSRLRLALQCEKLKVTLSALRDAEITVDSILDGADFQSKMSRAAMEDLAAPLLRKITDLVLEALTTAAVEAPSLSAVEVVGGGARMPAVKEALERSFGRELNYTMDGSLAVAQGVALAARQLNNGAEAAAAAAAPAVPAVTGYTAVDMEVDTNAELVQRLVKAENGMTEIDAEEEAAAHVRNEMEGSVFSWRTALDGILANKLSPEDKQKAYDACRSAEDWLLDTPHDATLSTWTELIDRFNALLPAAAREERQKLEAERAAKRAQEEQERSSQLAAEQAARADRLGMAARMKEKGNSLFKSGQYEEAREAYIKALNSFLGFELERKEEAEANSVKTQCYLNMAACCQKMKLLDEAVHACNKALEIDETNIKAYFRRSQTYLMQQDVDKAMADLKKADVISPNNPDIQAEMKKVAQADAAQKQKQRDMYKRMFA